MIIFNSKDVHFWHFLFAVEVSMASVYCDLCAREEMPEIIKNWYCNIREYNSLIWTHLNIFIVIFSPQSKAIA